MLRQPQLPLSPKLTTKTSTNKRETLARLLAGELNFHGERSDYASHNLHAFAAKFPPQLPRVFIRELTVPGHTVLDPMMGSGTTLVETILEGRCAIGLDLDPLALRLAQVKTAESDISRFQEIGADVIRKAKNILLNPATIEREFTSRYDEDTKKFIDYWFLATTQSELTALILAIDEIADNLTRQFLKLVFSSVIITKSGGVSRARDLAHSRPHLDKNKIPKNAVEQFEMRLRKSLASIANFNSDDARILTLSGDARAMPLGNETVDLIVTSPPYANAIDYMRAHKFSLVWFGHSVTELTKRRANYIGSERAGGVVHSVPLPEEAEATIERLAALDRKKSVILRKYFVEMWQVVSEMYRVLKTQSAAVVVVGTSTMRGIDVQTHLCLADIGKKIGFDVVGVAQRELDRNKRMMPARFGKKTDSMIEQRMHEEYVIGFFKPALKTVNNDHLHAE